VPLHFLSHVNEGGPGRRFLPVRGQDQLQGLPVGDARVRGGRLPNTANTISLSKRKPLTTALSTVP
jgi:hypothetical protein